MFFKSKKVGWMLLDFLFILVAFFSAYEIRQRFFTSSIQSPDFYSVYISFSTISFLILFSVFNLYEIQRFFHIYYLVDFLKALALWILSLVAFAFFTKTDYSRLLTLFFFIFTSSLIFLGRFLIAWKRAKKETTKEDIEIISIIRELTKLKEVPEYQLILLKKLYIKKTDGLFYIFSKRLFDIFLSILGLILVLPFFPLVIFLIRRDGLGSALIVQKRVGKDGRIFNLYKFRTMKSGVDLYAFSPIDENDNRITIIGKFLRKYSIDELPQLWNVLRGDMSIVGPRPEMPFIVEKYELWQRMRLMVKPGITGLWQIFGRKDLLLHENIEYDIYYIFNKSLFLDFAIILKTVPHLLFPRGAY